MKLLKQTYHKATLELTPDELHLANALIQEGRISHECDSLDGQALEDGFRSIVIRMDEAAKSQFEADGALMWSSANPSGIDLTRPYLYLIRVVAPHQEFRYIGKGSNPSRLEKEYQKNIEKIFQGKPKRPVMKRNGTPQSEGNKKFRYIHLVLAAAKKYGWTIEHRAIENCVKADHNTLERQRMVDYNCNANDGPTWYVGDFERLARELSGGPDMRKLEAHYREKSDDYSIKVGDGSMYIKPQDGGLTITAHPSVESAVTALLGEPTGRDSPESRNYAKWFISK